MNITIPPQFIIFLIKYIVSNYKQVTSWHWPISQTDKGSKGIISTLTIIHQKHTHTPYLLKQTHINTVQKSSIILQPNLTAALFCPQNLMYLVYFLTLNS